MAFTWVICIDGTWNQPGQTDRDPVTEKEEARPSNVAKTWQALADIPLATDFYYGAIAPLKTKVALTGLEGEVLYLKRYRHHWNRHKISRRRNGHWDIGTNSRCLSFPCRALPRWRPDLWLRLQSRRLCHPQPRRFDRCRRLADTPTSP